MRNNLCQAVIWDMDGVLVDTSNDHYEAWETTYRRYSNDEDPLTRIMFDSIFGMRNDMTIKQLFGEVKATDEFIDQVSLEKEALFRNNIQGRLKPLPGVWTWLTYFQNQGLQQAVASSAPEANVTAIMDEIKAYPFFEVVLSGDALDSLASKPAPGIFLEAARQMKVLPDHCLVIEDAVVGVQAAKAANMACLAVTTTHQVGDLLAANWSIDSFKELRPKTMLEMWRQLAI